MHVSSLNNINFKGKIVPHIQVLGEVGEDFDKVIKSSQVLMRISEKLPNDDIHVYVKKHYSSNEERFKHGKDEELFRVIFKLKKPVRNFLDKISNFFSARIPLTSRFHSKDTTLGLLHNKRHLTEIFSKYIEEFK